MAKHNLKPLGTIIKELNQKGYTSQFTLADNMLVSFNSDKSYEPSEVLLEEELRFEGDSNPDDMAILYQIKCRGGEKGTVVASYGAKGNFEIHEFMNQVPKQIP